MGTKKGRKKRKLKTLRDCMRCRQVKYCSKACLEADWNTHKKFCKSRVAKPGTYEYELERSCGIFQQECETILQSEEAHQDERSGQRKAQRTASKPSRSGRCCAKCSKSKKDVKRGGGELQKCSQCKSVWYCDKSCQK